MPSDKAKLNKALTATCVACNKPVSTESAVALTGIEDGHHKQYTVATMRERRMASAGLRRHAVVPPRVTLRDLDQSRDA